MTKDSQLSPPSSLTSPPWGTNIRCTLRSGVRRCCQSRLCCWGSAALPLVPALKPPSPGACKGRIRGRNELSVDDDSAGFSHVLALCILGQEPSPGGTARRCRRFPEHGTAGRTRAGVSASRRGRVGGLLTPPCLSHWVPWPHSWGNPWSPRAVSPGGKGHCPGAHSRCRPCARSLPPPSLGETFTEVPRARPAAGRPGCRAASPGFF